MVWCPGCNELHNFVVTNEQGDQPKNTPVWDWDRNVESPTFSPSMLVKGPESVCHSFLRNGVWEFLSDSTHALRGHKALMVDLPDWLSI